MFTKSNISIFVIWLFHISGVIGIHLGFTEFFLSKSWFTLTLSACLLLLNSHVKQKFLLLALVAFLGFGAEVLGVQTGALFGNYQYGQNLGLKLWGVPLVIGLNWLMLGIISFTLAKLVFLRTWLRVVLAALFMVLIDVAIEPVAPTFDYWAFEGGMPSIHNYLGWFIVAIPVQWCLAKTKIETNLPVAVNLLLAQLLFFVAFYG